MTLFKKVMTSLNALYGNTTSVTTPASPYFQIIPFFKALIVVRFTDAHISACMYNKMSVSATKTTE
jgi:hypothetical protein